MSRERCLELFRDADAVLNLCGATEPREEHERSRCLIYLETDPGVLQIEVSRRIPSAVRVCKIAQAFFHLWLQYRRARLPAPVGRPQLASHPAAGDARRMASGRRPRQAAFIHHGRNLAKQRQRHGDRGRDLLLVEARQFPQSARSRARARRSRSSSRPISARVPTTSARLPADSVSRRQCRCRSISTTIATTSADRAVNSPSPRIFMCARARDGSAIARYAIWQRDVRLLPSAPDLRSSFRPATDCSVSTRRRGGRCNPRDQCRLSAACARGARDRGRVFRRGEIARRNRGGRGDLNDGADPTAIDARPGRGCIAHCANSSKGC